jgi:hypothetical protein
MSEIESSKHSETREIIEGVILNTAAKNDRDNWNVDLSSDGMVKAIMSLLLILLVLPKYVIVRCCLVLALVIILSLALIIYSLA